MVRMVLRIDVLIDHFLRKWKRCITELSAKQWPIYEGHCMNPPETVNLCEGGFP